MTLTSVGGGNDVIGFLGDPLQEKEEKRRKIEKKIADISIFFFPLSLSLSKQQQHQEQTNNETNYSRHDSE